MKNLRLKSKTPKTEEVLPNILFLSKPRKKKTFQPNTPRMLTQQQLQDHQESKTFSQFIIKRSYTRQPSPQTSPRIFDNISSQQGIITSRTDRISSGLTNSTDVMTTQTLIKQHKFRDHIPTINERTEEDVQNQRQFDVLGTFIIMDSKNSVSDKIFSKLPTVSKLHVSHHSNYSLKIQKCLKNFMALESIPKIIGRRKQSMLWDKADNPFSQKIEYKNSQQVFKLYFVQKLEVYVKKLKILQFEQVGYDLNMEEDYIEFNHRQSLKHQDKIKKFYFPYQQENYQQPKHKGFMYEYDINAKKLSDKLIHFDIWIDDDIQYLENELDHFTNDYYQNEEIQNVDIKNKIFDWKDVIKPLGQTRFILSEVDEVPKNFNLTEYDQQMDQSIYESNLHEKLPDIQQYYKGTQLRKQLAKLYYLKFPEILSGRYTDYSVLVDFEHQEPVQVVIDKKKIMMSMKNKNLQSNRTKRQLLDIPNSSSRSLMSRKTKQQISQISKSFECLDDVSKCGSDKVSCKSLEQDQDLFDQYNGFSFRNQMRLNYYQFFDDLIKSNRSPIEIASKLIQHNLLHELQIFMKNAPNLRLNDRTGDGTPLIAIAAKSGNMEIVQYLLQQDVNIDAQDLDGNTALHHALAMRNFPIADILISQGANVLIRNKLKYDAFKMAQN